MDLNGYIAALWVLLLCFLAWRISSCVKRKMPLTQEATAVVYLILLGVLQILFTVIPGWTRNASIAAAVICLLLSGAISYQINRRYSRWLDEELEKEKNDRASDQ